MWKTAWDITSANSGAKRLKKNPDVTSWAEGQIRQVVSPSSLVPGPLSTLADRGRGLPPARAGLLSRMIRSTAARPRRRLARRGRAIAGTDCPLRTMAASGCFTSWAMDALPHDARQAGQLSLRLA